MRKIPLVAIENAITRLNSAISLLVKSAKSTANRNGLFLDAVQRIEEVCLQMRKEAIACATSDREREAIIERSIDNLNIIAEMPFEDILHVHIPRILPSKKRSTNISLIVEPLRAALNSMPKKPFSSKRQTIIIQHNYPESTPDILLRDHDNYETKRISDIICYYCMPDDCIKYCDRLYTSKTASEASTDIWVIPSAKLPEWLLEDKK